MRFRTRLLLLLLSISLLPMLLLRCNSQRLATGLAENLGGRVADLLIRRSSDELERQVAAHAFTLQRERQLLELALQRQAEALLATLTGEQHHPPLDASGPLEPSPRHCRLDPAGACTDVPVSYGRFSPLLAMKGSALPELLQPVVPVFRDIALRLPDLVLWQMVHILAQGTAGYPATELQLPPAFQGSRRMLPLWCRRALRSDGPVWGQPHPDPLTGRMVLTVSTTVRNEAGEPLAVTAMLVEIDALLHADMHLRALSEHMQTLVVSAQSDQHGAGQSTSRTTNAHQHDAAEPPSPEATAEAPELVILARKTPAAQELPTHHGRGVFRAATQERVLHSRDTEILAEVARDMAAGRSGLRTLDYQGRPSIWAYGAMDGNGTALLLILPAQDLVTPAAFARQVVLQSFETAKQFSGLMLLLVFAAMLPAVLLLSRRLTRRIEELAHGFHQVAKGDFTVRVPETGRDEVAQLSRGFNAMVPALEERIHICQALDTAREVQRSLLPLTAPELPGFLLAGGCVYSESIGGDYFDYIPGVNRSQALGLVVGDVTGHGLPAALLMTTARAFLRQRAALPGGPGAVLADVNRLLHQDVDQSGRFMTLFYAVLDPATRRLAWARAGHDPALLYSPSRDAFTELGGAGLPLGTVGDWEFAEHECVLRPGDLLCLATDGVWETENPQGEMFGKERLRTLLRELSREHPQAIAAALLQELRAFHGRDSFEDDVTLLLVQTLP